MKTQLKVLSVLTLLLTHNSYAQSSFDNDSIESIPTYDALAEAGIDTSSISNNNLKMNQLNIEGTLPVKPKESSLVTVRKLIENENIDEMIRQLEKDRITSELERNKNIKDIFKIKSTPAVEISPVAQGKDSKIEDNEDESIEDKTFIVPKDLKPIVYVSPAIPSIPAKKEVDIKLLQLSCDEFKGRLINEAFPLCEINLNGFKYSKIELTLNEEGRISNFDNSLMLPENKKSCISGYVANRPAANVGAIFTCRILVN